MFPQVPQPHIHSQNASSKSPLHLLALAETELIQHHFTYSIPGVEVSPPNNPNSSRPRIRLGDPLVSRRCFQTAFPTFSFNTHSSMCLQILPSLNHSFHFSLTYLLVTPSLIYNFNIFSAVSLSTTLPVLILSDIKVHVDNLLVLGLISVTFYPTLI